MAGNPQKKSTGIVNAAIGALAVVLAILIVWMMNLVSGIQGTARIINYAGLVRGKTQLIVKPLDAKKLAKSIREAVQNKQ